MAKTHPHIESPTDDDLLAAAASKPEAIRDIYVALHHLVVGAVPGIRASLDTVDASVGYAERQLGYDGWGMAAVTPYAKWASLTLLGGSLLDDPAGLLSGTAKMRHVKVTTMAQLKQNREAISALVQAAATLYAS